MSDPIEDLLLTPNLKKKALFVVIVLVMRIAKFSNNASFNKNQERYPNVLKLCQKSVGCSQIGRILVCIYLCKFLAFPPFLWYL